jgi:hypothetical protein
MKKISSISLALLLLIATVGVTISRHYCDSILVDTSFISPIADACDMDMPMDADDCEDDHQHFNVDSPLVLLSLNYDLAPSFTWIKNLQIISIKDFSANHFTSKFLADISPPPPEPDIYTRVQAFLL